MIRHTFKMSTMKTVKGRINRRSMKSLFSVSSHLCFVELHSKVQYLSRCSKNQDQREELLLKYKKSAPALVNKTPGTKPQLRFWVKSLMIFTPEVKFSANTCRISTRSVSSNAQTQGTAMWGMHLVADCAITPGSRGSGEFGDRLCQSHSSCLPCGRLPVQIYWTWAPVLRSVLYKHATTYSTHLYECVCAHTGTHTHRLSWMFIQNDSRADLIRLIWSESSSH